MGNSVGIAIPRPFPAGEACVSTAGHGRNRRIVIGFYLVRVDCVRRTGGEHDQTFSVYDCACPGARDARLGADCYGPASDYPAAGDRTVGLATGRSTRGNVWSHT